MFGGGGGQNYGNYGVHWVRVEWRQTLKTNFPGEIYYNLYLQKYFGYSDPLIVYRLSVTAAEIHKLSDDSDLFDGVPTARV